MVKKADLKDAGLKVTGPRLKILNILSQSDQKQHLTAEVIFKQLQKRDENVSLATIYRVLTQFAAVGIVKRHNFESGDSAVFELDEGEHHDHLICTQCSEVLEFVSEQIETQQTLIAQEKGYQMTDHTLVIYGLCRACQEK